VAALEADDGGDVVGNQGVNTSSSTPTAKASRSSRAALASSVSETWN
jgi:hypothetical protein